MTTEAQPFPAFGRDSMAREAAALEPKRIEVAESLAGLEAEGFKAEEVAKVASQLQTDSAEAGQIMPAGAALKKPRRRPDKRNRGPRAPGDGLNLRQREEAALQRLQGGALGLADLLAAHCSAGKEARLDIRVLAARLFVTEVTPENARAKLREFQDSVAHIASGFALTSQERQTLASAFTKAATERVQSFF
ncbi:MAG: hypothetical protein EB084_10950 [Proteobacteria bacterium]|nr:hypothetical protein [Pseudomonadota bacterium]